MGGGVMDPVIRRAVVDDIEALASLYVEFHNFHAAGVPDRLRPVPGVDDELRDGIRRILADEKGALFVALQGNAVVGFAEVYMKETLPNSAVVQRRYAHLQGLAVTAVLRRQGVGVRLMAEVEAWARNQGAAELETETWEFTEGPLRFYEGLGFGTRKRVLAKRLE